MDFFTVTAQVIPVLFVILAIEQRTLFRTSFYDEDHPRDHGDDIGEGRFLNPFFSLWMIWATGLLTVGELAALFALATGEDTETRRGLAWAAVVVGGGAVVAPVIGYQWRAVKRTLGGGQMVALSVFFVAILAYVTQGAVQVLGNIE